MASILVVDGANFDALRKTLGLYVNYKSMLEYVNGKFGSLIRGYYFTAVREHGNPDEDFYPLIRVLDSLEYNGFTVFTKEAMVMTNSEGKTVVKGNMDVELALTTYKVAMNSNVTDIVLVTGDGDFVELVKCLQDLGKRVSVMFSKKINKPLLSDRLLRQADCFVEMLGKPFIEEHRNANPRDDVNAGPSTFDANAGGVRIIRTRTRIVGS